MEVGRLLAAAMQASRHDRHLLSSPETAHVLAKFVDLATKNKVTAVVGAGAAGERLVGALLFHARGQLHLWDWVTPERVLVVDGVVASPVGVLSTMELVKRSGASGVLGAAMPTPTRTTTEATHMTPAAMEERPAFEVFAA